MACAISPELVVSDAQQAIEWYCQVFDGKIEFEWKNDAGKMLHSMIRLSNGGTIIVVDDMPEHHHGRSKLKSQEDAVTNNIALTVKAADAPEIWKRAVSKGSKVTLPFEKQFWGGVYGRFVDPFGHEWALDQKVEAAADPVDDIQRS